MAPEPDELLGHVGKHIGTGEQRCTQSNVIADNVG